MIQVCSCGSSADNCPIDSLPLPSVTTTTAPFGVEIHYIKVAETVKQTLFDLAALQLEIRTIFEPE